MSPTPEFVVILPVKPPATGKSRLTPGGVDRPALAAAFALDTADTAIRTPGVAGVLVVCDDHRFAHALAEAGCVVVPDAVAGDLNETLRQGAAEAVRRWPGTVPVALLADLPALRSEDLAAALRQVHALALRDRAAYVMDADGTGTVLYAAPLERFSPRFGRDSARAHAEAGAEGVSGDLASLRRDVDDVDALAAARRLGVGAHTAAVLG